MVMQTKELSETIYWMNFAKDKGTLRKMEGDQKWRFTELWQSGFSVFTDKHFVNEIVEEYRKESGYFEIDTNDMISLTDR
jgi:hypothetical protein